VIAMMAISSPQYMWTLFTGPLNQKLGTTLAELQWTFSLLIILQTWCSPLQAGCHHGAAVDPGEAHFGRLIR
jgi:MFS transporter, OFA family, oxalate/formate antiporter